MSNDSTVQSTSPQPAIGCLLRLFWMAAGNVALFFAAMQVAASERIGVTDAAYAGVVLALLLARYIDVTKLNGMTTSAEPATRAHLRRYIVVLCLVAALGWLAARFMSASMT
jgi:hypothetical protein